MLKGIHIGCSGWSYEKDWRSVFYKSRGSLLKQYLSVFDTAEINSTFYALPQKNFIRHIAEIIPSKKFFTAKIPKKITHDNRLSLSGASGQELDMFFQLLYPIKGRIKALLIQLPPWDIESMADLETFLSELDSSFRYAIEFRHESWINSKVMSLLENYHIAYVIVDEPRIPIDVRVTTDFSYIRWHGHGEKLWYNYLYTIDELRPWVARLHQLNDLVDTTFGYFNNHLFGNAPLNALQMLELLDMITAQQQIKLREMMASKRIEQTSIDEYF